MHTNLPACAKILSMAVCLAFIGAGVSAGQSVDVWYTSSDGSKKLAQQPSVSFATDAGSNSTTITVDENVRYQVMDGFGAAITGSAAYVINRHMTSTQRDALLTELFTSSGIDLNFIRRPIGASDFDLVSYTYDDMPSGQTDPNLANFSIDYDRTDILPVIHSIRQKNSGLKVMGTPWTAPAWMKKPTSLNGGSLSSSWYGTYANYLVKFVQAYVAEGIPIESITIQNEPLHTTGQLKTTATAGGGVTVNFCIDTVTHASLTYDPSQNESGVTSCSSAGKAGLLRLDGEEAPASFMLEEPHPNPFNPSTTIAFTLPQDDVVTLSVHDMLGRQMDRPIEGLTLSAGRHSIRYDASHLASGAYLIRLTTPTATKTTKMHLMK